MRGRTSSQLSNLAARDARLKDRLLERGHLPLVPWRALQEEIVEAADERPQNEKGAPVAPFFNYGSESLLGTVRQRTATANFSERTSC